MNGAERIAFERHRQTEVEGWDTAHDSQHSTGELIQAAIEYAMAAEATYYGENNISFAEWRKPDKPPTDWPWDDKWWKPSFDPIRNLEKAGALIAAEIDRLLHLAEHEEPCEDCP